jgi:hypothetical protein
VLPALARDVPVCLYMGSIPAATAVRARRVKPGSLIPLGPSSFMPLVAVLWPKRVAEDFLFWAETAKTTRADDGNAAKWMRARKQEVLVAVPSLVQHDASVPSVKGLHNSGSWSTALLLSEDGSEFLSL